MERTRFKSKEKYMLPDNGFIILHNHLLNKYGLQITVFISNLINKYIYFLENKTLDDEGMFFLTHNFQIIQTGLSDHQLRKCKQKAIAEGMISTKWKGQKAKEFYKVNLQHEYIVSALEKFEGLGLEKLKGLGLEKFEGYISKTYIQEKHIEEIKISSSGGEGFLGKLITPSMFNKFWNLYPRKDGKGKSLTKWKTICNRSKKDRPTWITIRKAILKQAKSERWQKPKYIPLPATWLNQSRWLDDPKEMVNYDRKPQSKITIGYHEEGKKYTRIDAVV